MPSRLADLAVGLFSKTDAHVKCRNGLAQLLPGYTSADKVVIGRRTVRVTIKEIETADELRGYKQLAQYHYRGKELHGRRCPLILACHDPLLPSVLGYVELATAFLMNKPRATLLDTEYAGP